FFFQAEDGIRDSSVTGVQTCALPILDRASIRALSLGTGNVILPLASGTPEEDPDLVAHAENSNLLADVRKLAGSILDDPPDVAKIGRASCRERGAIGVSGGW